MKELLSQYVLNKSFFIGALVCIGLLSNYIFGDDNLLQDIMELVIKSFTGVTIDLDIDKLERIR